MPRKPPQTPTKPRKTTPPPPGRPRKAQTPQTAPERQQTGPEPIADERAAQVWALREEGFSYRQIAKEVGSSLSTVASVLHSSPDRLNILIAAQREERGRLWAQHENRSLVQAITMQEAVFRSFFDMAGKIKKGKLTVLRREGSKWAAIMRQSANDAAGRINLLAGGPTERIEATDATAEVLDTEWLLRKAISLGRLDLLPPALRLVAEKRAAESGQVGTEP